MSLYCFHKKGRKNIVKIPTIDFEIEKMNKGNSRNVSSKCSSSGQNKIMKRIEVLLIIVKYCK